MKSFVANYAFLEEVHMLNEDRDQACLGEEAEPRIARVGLVSGPALLERCKQDVIRDFLDQRNVDNAVPIEQVEGFIRYVDWEDQIVQSTFYWEDLPLKERYNDSMSWASVLHIEEMKGGDNDDGTVAMIQVWEIEASE